MKNFRYLALGICTLGLLPTQSHALPVYLQPEGIKNAAFNIALITQKFVKNNKKELAIGAGIVGTAATGTALYIYYRNQSNNQKALETLTKAQGYKNSLNVYKQVSSASFAEQQKAFEQVAAQEHKTFAEYEEQLSNTSWDLKKLHDALPNRASYKSIKADLKIMLKTIEPLCGLVTTIRVSKNAQDDIQTIERKFEKEFKAMETASLEEQKMVIRRSILSSVNKNNDYPYTQYDRALTAYIAAINNYTHVWNIPEVPQIKQLMTKLGNLRAVVQSTEEYREEVKNYREDKRQDRELRHRERENAYHKMRMYDLQHRVADVAFLLALDQIRRS